MTTSAKRVTHSARIVAEFSSTPDRTGSGHMSTGSERAHVTDDEARLTAAEVATLQGWTAETVHSYTWMSRAKVAAGRELTPADFPLPDRYVGRTPVWTVTQLRRYDSARAEAARAFAFGGGGPVSTHVLPVEAYRVVRHDVVITLREGRSVRRVVLGTRAAGAAHVELLLGARRRDPGKWEKFGKEERLLIHRKTPG